MMNAERMMAAVAEFAAEPEGASVMAALEAGVAKLMRHPRAVWLAELAEKAAAVAEAKAAGWVFVAA